MVVNLFPFTGRWAWPVPSAGPTVIFTPPSSGRPVRAPTPRRGATCTPAAPPRQPSGGSPGPFAPPGPPGRASTRWTRGTCGNRGGCGRRDPWCGPTTPGRRSAREWRAGSCRAPLITPGHDLLDRAAERAGQLVQNGEAAPSLAQLDEADRLLADIRLLGEFGLGQASEETFGPHGVGIDVARLASLTCHRHASRLHRTT